MKSLLDSETKRDFKIRLLGMFEANRHDVSFQGLVNIYIHQILPLILQKLSDNETGIRIRRNLYFNKLDWFRFWLATMTDKQLNLSFPILDNPFHHFDNHQLSHYPFPIIVRNIPTFMWAYLRRFPHSMLLHLASGKSIRTYPEIVPMSRKLAHVFQNLTYGSCNAEEYYLYCLVKLMGGNEAFFQMVSPYIRLSGNLESDKNVLKHYTPALKKLLEWNALNKLNSTERRRLMGFIDHKLHEKNHFSFKGRTLKAMLQLSEEYYTQQELRQMRIQQEMLDNSLIKWAASRHQEWNQRHEEAWFAIFELRNSYQLQEESSQMNHCVHGYAEECANEKCSIWSLRRKKHDTDDWLSLVTIEMDQYSRLVQIKAKFNQQPKTEHMKMIKDWVKQEALEISLYEY